MLTLRTAAGRVAFFLRFSFWPFSKPHFASRNKAFVLNFREMEMALLLRVKLLTLLHKSHDAGAIVEDIFLLDFQALGCFATVVLEIECQEK